VPRAAPEEATSPRGPGASPSSSSTARAGRADRGKAHADDDDDDVEGDPNRFIFRPRVEVPPTPLPRGTHRQWLRPGSSSGNSRASTPNLSFSGSLSRPGTASAIPAVEGSASFDEAEPPPAIPRIAWSEGGARGGLETSGAEVLDLATQLRRDLLAFRLSEGTDEAGDASAAAGGGGGGGGTANAAGPDQRWLLRTPDAQKSFEDMERSLAKANQRTESSRRELSQYLDELQARTFRPPPAEPGAEAASEEPLVSIPADFDDVVDLNAQIAGSHRRALPAPGDASGSGGGASVGFKLPSFLEKYFLEDKAVEQLPHRQLQDKEEKAKGGEETELQRGLRQIARLDGLLAKREAAGNARVKAAKVEFEAAKDRIQRHEDDLRQQKIATLQKLKEKGLMKSNSSAPRDKSSASTSASSAASGRSGAAENHTKLAVVELPRSPMAAGAIVEWSGWTSTADPEEISAPASLEAPDEPPTPARGPAEHPDEPDTGTFLLTSMTGHLGDLAAPRRQQAARAAAEAARRASGHTPSSSSRPSPEVSLALATIKETEKDGADEATLVSIDEGEEELEALPEFAVGSEHPYADNESLEALRRIDERLQKLVPESEWEAKSISSAPRGSTADGSRPRSVWSSHGVPALPGEPELRERAELREASVALQAIDNRLSELQLEHSKPPESRPPDPKSLRKLLLQAAQETAPLDSRDKVMALTMHSFNGTADGSVLNSGSLAGEHSALVPVTAPHARLPDSVPLKQARQVLDRLAGYNQEWEEANREADSAWQSLEHEVRILEETAATGEPPGGPARTLAIADGGEEPQIRGADSAAEIAGALGPFSERLSELGAEVAALAEGDGPSAELAAKLREGGPLEAARPGVALSAMGLPVLSSATVQDDDEDEDFGGISDGEPTELTFAAPSSISGGPSADLLRALEIQLPAEEGPWDDAELERVVRAMDAHYGDEPPVVDLQQEDLAPSDEGGEDRGGD